MNGETHKAPSVVATSLAKYNMFEAIPWRRANFATQTFAI